jgi:hypothetical protein
LEGSSLLEMLLWSISINKAKSTFENSKKQVKIDDSQPGNIKIERIDRQACRISSGVETVISNVLPFLTSEE